MTQSEENESKNIEYETLINCDHVKIERHYSGTGYLSSIKSFVERYCSCSPYFAKVFSALFYGLASFLIVVVNKIILTNYKFPSFYIVGIGQMLSTILILSVAKHFSLVSFPDFSRHVVKKVCDFFPLLSEISLILSFSSDFSTSPSVCGQSGVWPRQHETSQLTDVYRLTSFHNSFHNDC